MILNKSAIGVMELISSTLRRYIKKEKIRSGLDELLNLLLLTFKVIIHFRRTSVNELTISIIKHLK